MPGGLDAEWRSFDDLRDMEDQERARAVVNLVGGDRRLRRVRPMSRREAYLAGLKGQTIERVDDWFMPHFMDLEQDLKTARISEDGLIGFRDQTFYGRDKVFFRAEVSNRKGWKQMLAPGREVSFIHNPLIPGKIWIVDPADGRTMGTCPQFARAPAADRHAIEVTMGRLAQDRQDWEEAGRFAAGSAKRMAAVCEALAKDLCATDSTETARRYIGGVMDRSRLRNFGAGARELDFDWWLDYPEAAIRKVLQMLSAAARRRREP